jgi:hypothetical protein
MHTSVILMLTIYVTVLTYDHIGKRQRMLSKNAIFSLKALLQKILHSSLMPQR